MLALKQTSPPQAEPLSITDAVVKQHMRIVDTSEDLLLTLILQKCREAAEQITRRALITQSWLMVLDTFPAPSMETSSANWYGPSWGTGPGPLTSVRPDGRTLTEIFMPLPPLISVDSIQYYDAATGILTTLDPSQYVVDNVSEPARIVPAPNCAWPATLNRINAVQIAFTCGYGVTSGSVPAGIRDWILMMAGTLYENRELIAVLSRGRVDELPLYAGLLDGYRVVKF